MHSKPLIIVLVALAACSVLGLSIASRQGPASGLVDGRLRPCPPSPNCVSSQASEPTQRIEPLAFYGEPYGEFERLASIVQGLPRTRLLHLDSHYAHFEITSSIFRFRRDVEFQLQPDAGVIHLRSASRVGHSDFGSNREFVSQVRDYFRGLPAP